MKRFFCLSAALLSILCLAPIQADTPDAGVR